jgi:hypothetical protein
LTAFATKVVATYRKQVPAQVRGWVHRLGRIALMGAVAYATRQHAPIDPAAWVGLLPGMAEAGWRAVVASPEHREVLTWLEAQGLSQVKQVAP